MAIKKTPDEFKKMMKEKGWTNKELAIRWSISATWVSKLINIPERRDKHWDDALEGLPTKDEL